MESFRFANCSSACPTQRCERHHHRTTDPRHANKRVRFQRLCRPDFKLRAHLRNALAHVSLPLLELELLLQIGWKLDLPASP
eukprot:1438851-Rhodomonas_salina.2